MLTPVLRTSLVILAASSLLVGLQAHSEPTTIDPARLPKRLILALDGVGYESVRELQTAPNGCLKALNPAVRNISTFPSLSDISWHDITRVGPTEGYQRFHYSVGYNKIIGGGATAELSNTQEYERRMHVILMEPKDHRDGYLKPMQLAERELETIRQRFLTEQNLPTLYAYMLSTDTLQHTDGDIGPLLCKISDAVEGIITDYQKLTGRAPEIAIVSDHGNNHHQHGKLLQVRKNLRKAGFHVAKQIQSERDVVFTTSGLLNSMSVFAQPQLLRDIGNVILGTEGVDLITLVSPENPETIEIRNTSGGFAQLRKAKGRNAFSYTPVRGDPLGYETINSNLKASGDLDDDGFAEADIWLRATSELKYPAALERIWRGHHVITLNPAPMLVSLKYGYEITYGVLKLLSSMVPRGGTHGALTADCSNGVFLSNFITQPHDTTTNRVGAWLGFKDMRNWQADSSGGQLTSKDYLERYGYPEQASGASTAAPYSALNLPHPPSLETNPVLVNLWDPDASNWKAMGIETRFKFELTSKTGIFKTTTLSRSFLTSEMTASRDGREFRISLTDLAGDSTLLPGNYRLKVWLQREDAKPGPELFKKAFYEAQFTVDIDGSVVIW